MSDTTTNKGEEVNKERLYSREEVGDMMEEVRYDKFFTGLYIGLGIGITLGICLWSLIKF
jgi:hypothetical protein